MVDIIRRGTIPDKRIIDFNCSKCCSSLRATVGEAIGRDSSYQGTFLTFECPVCRSRVCTELKPKKSS